MRKTHWILICMLGWSLVGLYACSQTKAVDECWYGLDGSERVVPCLSLRYEVAKPTGSPIDSLDAWQIHYVEYHTYTEVRDFCEEMRGERTNGCIYRIPHLKIAVIHHVYGDLEVKAHEEGHITHGDYHTSPQLTL